MASVIEFPGGGAPRSALPPLRAAPAHRSPAARAALLSTGGMRGEYALADVARSLGLLHFGVRTIVEKLRSLAAHANMPLPRTPRIVGGFPKNGPLTIYSKSRWDAGEFDAWLLGRGPAGPQAVVPVPAPIRDDMRRRAEQIAAA